MHILADENITLASHYFGTYGRLTLCPGRRIDRAMLRDVDVLLVRSVTRVDADLLAESPCRFVATATSGIDHIDTDYLQQHGIGLGWARGCNAEGVVDYVFSALATLALERDLDWRRCGIGIVGCGEIGGRLAQRLLALGIAPRIHDPLLEEAHPLTSHFAPLEEVLQQPVVSLHVPLTDSGAAPTRRLIERGALARLGPHGVLINASRGEVVDEAALLQHCRRHADFCAILDAWQGEPAIDVAMLQQAMIGTAHIAGYSNGGKLRGTLMIHDAFCHHFGFDPAAIAPAGALEVQTLCYQGGNTLQGLSQLVLQAYDLRGDDVRLRAAVGVGSEAGGFDRLRRDYALRREFGEFAVWGLGEDPALRAAVAGLGMRPA
ncbi:MAG TPA: 4-phosphoerythronate dehydrogenase [Hyphomicrobiales bacterium]|nr:4-phosphoerythronate dehydrogenase [Hyphomicrobiales bacterium]